MKTITDISAENTADKLRAFDEEFLSQRTAQDIKRDIRDTKRAMKAQGIRIISWLNGGLSSQERDYNMKLFTLKTELLKL